MEPKPPRTYPRPVQKVVDKTGSVSFEDLPMGDFEPMPGPYDDLDECWTMVFISSLQGSAREHETWSSEHELIARAERIANAAQKKLAERLAERKAGRNV